MRCRTDAPFANRFNGDNFGKSFGEVYIAAGSVGRSRRMIMREVFRKFAQRASQMVGSSWAFILVVLLIIVWALTGPWFHYSDTWQLLINTASSIVTFLMVFLIQNTQNRDAKAIHLKLDELLRGVAGARTGMVNLQHLSEAELETLQEEFRRLHLKENQKSASQEPSKTK